MRVGREQVFVLAVAALLMAGVAGCGTEPQPVGKTTAEQSLRCQRVAPKVVGAISTGINTSGIRLRGARAVRSGDYKRFYFVAADLQGAGLTGKDDIAVWATNRIADYGSIFSADAVASEFSDWGNGPGFSSFDDGYDAAVDCTRRALRAG